MMLLEEMKDWINFLQGKMIFYNLFYSSIFITLISRQRFSLCADASAEGAKTLEDPGACLPRNILIFKVLKRYFQQSLRPLGEGQDHSRGNSTKSPSSSKQFNS